MRDERNHRQPTDRAVLQMGRHRPLTLSWLVNLFSAGQLFFTNLQDNIANNNSAGRNDTEEKSNTVSLPPSSPPSGPNEGAGQPRPPDESRGAAAPGLPERGPQTPAPRVDDSGDNDDEERPKPSDSLAVAGSCIVLLNTVPARDTIDRCILILYDAYVVLLFLALFISIGLYIHSLRPDSDHDNDRRVVKARKRVVMTVAVALVVSSIALRSTIDLPIATIELALPLLIIVAAVVLVSLYFYLIRKKQPGTTVTDTAGESGTG